MNKEARVKIGIPGLDEVLHGGLLPGSGMLLEGPPGAGKTTIGLQFIYQGALLYGEPGIIITFEELPEQVYRDALGFGWDLRSLEKANRIRVICTTPEILLSQMQQPGGLVDMLVEEIGAKRIFVDSLTNFDALEITPGKMRSTIYSFANGLKRLGLTALFTKEDKSEQIDSSVPFEEYIVDGVIRMYYRSVDAHFNERCLEVIKFRGSGFKSGTHVFRLDQNGVDILTPLTAIENIPIIDKKIKISTGVDKLDGILTGGLEIGSTCIIDTNRQANYRYLVFSIIVQQLLAGNNVLILLGARLTVADVDQMLKFYDLDLASYAEEQRVLFIDLYNRPVSKPYQGVTSLAKGMSWSQFQELIERVVLNRISFDAARNKNWFVYFDLKLIMNEFELQNMMNDFGEYISFFSTYQTIFLVLCNFSELPEDTGSFIQRNAQAIIKTWVKGYYQYMRIMKAPNRRISEPFIVQYIQEKPFFCLR